MSTLLTSQSIALAISVELLNCGAAAVALSAGVVFAGAGVTAGVVGFWFSDR